MSKKKSQFQQIQGLLKMKFLLLGILLGLVVGAIGVVIVTSTNKSRVVHDSKRYHPATYAVAEKFMCGCSQCNDGLADCDCSDSSGGKAELQYISERLKAGLPEEEVIKNVYGEFGRIKEKYQHLISEERSPHN